ncbi:hypothetical protein [Peribacillus muralis]|uniref:hypothetical protein n=1 Tax=Peribacillus muralis TaxID=264697 RepID=UPI003D00FC36
MPLCQTAGKLDEPWSLPAVFLFNSMPNPKLASKVVKFASKVAKLASNERNGRGTAPIACEKREFLRETADAIKSREYRDIRPFLIMQIMGLFRQEHRELVGSVPM